MTEVKKIVQRNCIKL